LLEPIAAPARAEDLAQVLALVRDAALPTEGIAEWFPGAYVMIRGAGQISAVAGLEVHGAHGLLRSLAVRPDQRRSGLGRHLVEERLQVARERRLDAVYLLTLTAADYFRRLGFEDVVRAHAPLELQRSGEFAALCPASAVCLAKTLR
jgi:amino-acid N-acetyltransferase